MANRGRASALGTGAVRVVVVGGGISGLAAAHRLIELSVGWPVPLELVLFESRDRLGGIIATERAGGCIIEAGPDAFLTEKPWGVALCERLGLADRLIPTRESPRRTFVLHRGRLEPLPDGFALLGPSRLGPVLRSPLLSWRGRLRLAMDLVLPRGRVDGDESVGAFVARRFGREVLDRVVQPLVSAVYTADPRAISLSATMPRFREMERRHRSIAWALARSATRRRDAEGSGPRWSLFVTLAGGMQDLVESLARRLPASAVRLRQGVTAVVPSDGPRRWRVDLAGGGTMAADGVIVATPAPQTARLVAALDPDLGRLCEAIPYASSATVTLAYRRADIGHPLDGFGFVVPRSAGRAILAGTFSSVKFPDRAPEGQALLRAFLGGALQQGLLDRDDDALAAAAEQDLADVLDIRARPILIRVHRHPAAMPQYLIGHQERVSAITAQASRHAGLALAGAAYWGVGIPDCIRSGEEAAERVLEGVTGGASPGAVARPRQ